DNKMVTTAAMRRLSFTLYERLVLIPVELVLALKSIAVIGAATLLLISVLGSLQAALLAFLAYLGAVLSGIELGPLLLPWLPGRSYAVKGGVVGLLYSLVFYWLAGGSGWNIAVAVSFFLALPAVSSFYTLNFTGCSPYTSRSGVKKEMRAALPAMGGAILIGVILLLAGRFL
ncbi:MAG: acetyl-CoA synthase subunit gamma, partial [Deltaproteobacteria bacterium]|nr:acetyl-CoA synthase subunit gamma [Deltaproteobacteria bacterium]